jgi:hypothetical protein
MQRAIFPRLVAIAVFHEVLHTDPQVTPEQRKTVEYRDMVESLDREVHAMLGEQAIYRLRIVSSKCNN